MTHNHGLLHINLNVSDVFRSVRFYTEALGFTVVTDGKETIDFGNGPELHHQVVLTVPGSRTLLALSCSPSSPVAQGGMNHMGLVIDTDDAVRELTQRVTQFGGIVQKQGMREEAGIAEAFAYVRDPDGYAIELSTQAILYAQCAALANRLG
jgi:lactoylglutathione lyase